MRVQGEKLLEIELNSKAPLCKCRYQKIADANPLLREMLTPPSKKAIETRRVKFPGLYNALLRLFAKYRINIWTLREEKRICDAILTTVHGNYFIEAKYNNGKLQDHQKKTQNDINGINGTYYIIRRISKVGKDKFTTTSHITIEQPEKNVLFKCDNVIDVFKWFNEERYKKVDKT
jgi:hypothetical protein